MILCIEKSLIEILLQMFNCNTLINESCDNDENSNEPKKVKDLIIPSKLTNKNIFEKVTNKIKDYQFIYDFSFYQ